MYIYKNQLFGQMKMWYKKLIRWELIKVWTRILAVWLNTKGRYCYRKNETLPAESRKQ